MNLKLSYVHFSTHIQPLEAALSLALSLLLVAQIILTTHPLDNTPTCSTLHDNLDAPIYSIGLECSVEATSVASDAVTGVKIDKS